MSQSKTLKKSIQSQQSKRPSGVAYLIGRLDRSLNRQLRHALSPKGITVSQYTALSIFDTYQQLTNARLAERTMVSPQAANELIKSMESKGWIERKPDPTHGRIIQISLTKPGKHLLSHCDKIVAELEEQILQELNTSERNTLKKNLKGLVRVLAEL